MEDVASTSIKQEILDKSVVGSSRKPIELSDEESSDGENSVIILDSDTEADDQGPEEEEDANDEEESEEDDEDEEESDDDSDSSVDSESINSVWSTVDEDVGDNMTTEAAEVNITKKFEKAMIRIADNDKVSGQRILKKLLEDPIIAQYRTEDPDYETIEEPPRLARMLQVFIAIHKNMAKLFPDDEVSHLCQVLAYEPNNSSVWFDVAMKCVENGDLDFAKYAFKRCESLKESLEGHATVLYLSCDYAACLQILKTFQDESEGLNDKMKYLKFKIRSTSQYYKQLSDKVFEEDEVYAELSSLDQRKIIVFDERIRQLMARIEKKKGELEAGYRIEAEKTSAIPISIAADQELVTVCTLFCDLFDRIHVHSQCRDQLIEFTEWESRKDFIDVRDTLTTILDVVECMEDISEKVDAESKKKGKKRKRKEEKKEYLANWKKRLFVEKSAEDVESEQNTTADEGDDEESQDEAESPKSSEMPENDLAAEFMLSCGNVVPIRTSGRTREKTPPPTRPCEFFNCDEVLEQLESKFSSGSHSILDILEGVLLLISDLTPSHGAIPEEMREVIREMYNRVALFVMMHSPKYDKLNVTLMEIGSINATKECVKKYISFFNKPDEKSEESSEMDSEEIRLLILRFMWKYANSGLSDSIQLEYLYSLQDCLQSEEVIPTSSGSFATFDIDLTIEDMEKKKRIESVKHLWGSQNYKELVNIIEHDIDFGAISNEETLEIVGFWLKSLEKLKKHVKLTEVAVRILHFYLFTEFSEDSSNSLQNLIEGLLEKLHHVKLKKVCRNTTSTLGYFICVAMKKYKELETKWKNWKLLYEIVKVQRTQTCLEYVESIERDDDPHAMPLLELDLLVKAHEVLGEHKCCSQDNYEFLLFVVDRFRELIEDIPTLELIYDNAWLWNNMNNEIAQLLFCMYGKYGRKRKAAEDHENGAKCAANMDIAKRVIPIILVQPLPLYDEKEKLSHDIVELLNSKFPFLLKVSAEKKFKVDGFTESLRESNTLEDVNRGLKKYREEEDEDGFTQSLIWYAMALSAYRTSSNKEAVKYSELYLLTEDSASDDRLRGSVWGILAHQNVLDLFQLEPQRIYEEWKWKIMPFRMAVDAQEHEPVPHFQLATTLYTIGSALERFYRQLPDSDPRKCGGAEIKALRTEAREHFDRSLELTKIGDDGTQPEHQWLCYFFIGKLEAKSASGDIVKVVESFYEAACGCELAGFYYPQKVQTKKQTNFEPLEVHYQTYAAVYKYLIKNENPPMEVLRKLRVLLKVVNDGHRVVKPSSSLFKVNPDVYSVVDSLVFDTVSLEMEQSADAMSQLSADVVDELKEMCARAFNLVTERFPHIKSYYRLAQIEFAKGNVEKASDHIFKNIFKRKKRDDGLFENVVEISSNDISRNGSHSFHIERCIRLGLTICQRLQDLHTVVSILATMTTVIAKDNDDHLAEEVWKTVVTMGLDTMEQIIKSRDVNARNTPSPALCEPNGPVVPTKRKALTTNVMKSELWRLHNTLIKCSKPGDELIKMMKAKTEEHINSVFKSVEAFRSQMALQSVDGGKKKNTLMKRKLDVTDAAKSILQLTGNQGAMASSSSSKILNQWAEQIAKKAALTTSSSASSLFPSTSISAISANQPSSSQIVRPVPAVPKPSQPPTSSSAANLPSTSSAVSTYPYLPLSDSDDEVQCLDPPPAKKTAVTPSVPPSRHPTLSSGPSTSVPRPVLSTSSKLTIPVQKPVAAPPKVVAKPAVPPKPTAPKPSTSRTTLNPSLSAAALASESLAAPSANMLQVLAAGISSTDLNTRTMALQLMSNIQVAQQAQQAAQAEAAAKAAREEQARKTLQTVQALAVQNAQSATAAKLSQALSQLSTASGRFPAVVRPTPVRPTATTSSPARAPQAVRPPPVPARRVPVRPEPQQQQPRPSMVGRPPTISSSPSTSGAPVRPTPVRPTASSSSTLSAAQMATLANPQVLQLLNSIPDDATKQRILQQLLSNQKH